MRALGYQDETKHQVQVKGHPCSDDTSTGLDGSGAIDDSDSLPPAVTEEVASVGSDDNQQRVVIESNVIL